MPLPKPPSKKAALLAAVEAHWQDSEYLKDDFALLVVRMK